MRVLVVGGGIGGLALAMRLDELGIDVEVFEAVRDLQPVGVGLVLLPHAMRELESLGGGVYDEVAAAGHRLRTLEFRSPDGRRIVADPRDERVGYRHPMVAIRRGALHAILWRAAEARLGRERVRRGWSLSALDQDEHRVSAVFTDKTSGQIVGRAEGDALVGADGVRSNVFRLLYPESTPLRRSGVTMFRGIGRIPRILDGATMISSGHWDQRLIVFPLGGPDEDGLVDANFVAEIRGIDADAGAPSTWGKRVQSGEFVHRYDDWQINGVDHRRLFASADVVRWALLDRDPLPRWSFGRVTLLGDAAHPIYPYGANGAAQALRDTAALEDAFRRYPSDAAEALSAYERARLGPMTELTEDIRGFCQERVQELARRRCEGACAEEHSCVPRGELEDVLERFKLLAGFHPRQLAAAAATSGGL